jgi:hypothetical protein
MTDESDESDDQRREEVEGVDQTATMDRPQQTGRPRTLDPRREIDAARHRAADLDNQEGTISSRNASNEAQDHEAVICNAPQHQQPDGLGRAPPVARSKDPIPLNNRPTLFEQSLQNSFHDLTWDDHQQKQNPFQTAREYARASDGGATKGAPMQATRASQPQEISSRPSLEVVSLESDRLNVPPQGWQNQLPLPAPHCLQPPPCGFNPYARLPSVASATPQNDIAQAQAQAPPQPLIRESLKRKYQPPKRFAEVSPPHEHLSLKNGLTLSINLRFLLNAYCRARDHPGN